MRVFRYIFYRIYEQRCRKMRDPGDAAFSAVLFYSLPILAIVLAVDVLVANLLDSPLLIDQLGKWPFAFLVLGSVFALIYWHMGRGVRVARIVEEFEGRQDSGVFGVWLVFLFFAIPILLLLLISTA